MIFLTEQEKTKITEHLGKNRSILAQIKKGTVGSPGCWIESIVTDISGVSISDFEEQRCLFEKYEKGLLLRINSKQKIGFIVFEAAKIEKILVIDGEEDKTARLLSPRWFAIKLGISMRYARYLRGPKWYLGVSPMTIQIKCNGGITLRSNGYNNHEFRKYFYEFTSA